MIKLLFIVFMTRAVKQPLQNMDKLLLISAFCGVESC